MGPQVEILDDRRPEPPDRVGKTRDADAAELRGLGRAADVAPPLEDEDAPAGLREVGRGDEPVVAAADDDRVVVPGPGRGRHQAALRPRERSTSSAAIRPFAPMIPPPGWVDEPHSQRSRIGVRKRA